MTMRVRLDLWRAGLLCLRTAGLALDCLAAVLWLSVPAAAADLVFGLTREQRLLFTALAAVWLLWRIAAGFAAFLPDLRMPRFAALTEDDLPALKGRLLSAMDLSYGAPNPGASADFMQRHIREAEERLRFSARPSFLSLKGLFPARRLLWLAAGACAAAAAAWSDPGVLGWFLNPLAPRPLENILEIRPGNASVIKGRPFRIEAEYTNGGEEEPELRLRASGEPWSRGFMSSSGPGKFVYAGGALGGDLLYRLKYKELQSRVYRLSAEDPPALEGLVFSAVPPAYTGREGVSYPYLPSEGEVLKGGLVSVSGTGSGRLSSAALVFEGGGVLPLRGPASGRIAAEFTVNEDAFYRLSLKNRDGLEAGSGERYVIRAVEDLSPDVDLLSPAFGSLESAPEETINAVYEASDDIGLKEIRLVRKVSMAGAPLPSLFLDAQTAAFPGPGPRRASGETELPLYDLPDGAEAEFRFTACDRSASASRSGEEGCSLSGAVRIKITDFSGRHAAAYAGIDALKKELGALGLREEGMISDLEKGRTFTSGEMAGYVSAWRKAADLAGRLEAELEKDPYMASGTLARYRLFREDMAYGAETAEAKAVPATMSGPQTAAAGIHGALKDALEAGERELEAIMRSEDARSSVAGFGAMARKAADMEDELSAMSAGNGSGSDADWRKLSRTLEKIGAELARIKALLGDRPPQKSDGRVFVLPAASAFETAGELAAAINGRNAAKAAELAARLAEKLSRMRRVMEEYASYRASEDARSDRTDRLSELSRRWQALYEAQRAAAEAGKEMEESLLAKTEKARAAVVTGLRAAFPELKTAALEADKDVPGTYASVLAAESGLQAGDPAGTRAALAAALHGLEKSTCAACAARLRPAEAGLRAGMASVSRLESDTALLEPEDMAMFPPAAERQKKIRSDGEALAGHIAGGYSGALSGGLLEKLDKAGRYMSGAVEALTAGNIRTAAAEQVRALNELETGGRSLEDTMDRMSSASAGAGAGGGGSSGGFSGVFTRPAPGMAASPVRLPKAGDYVPPAALREKVMESLRERYPASQKDLIEGYLRNIAK